MNPSSELIPFNFNGVDVRAIADEKGNPWLIAKDVCDALNLTWSGATLKPLKAEWCSLLNLNMEVGERKVAIISEVGAYKLAFRSQTDKAEAFTDWLASEVLPSLRKTGSYSLQPQAPQPPQLPTDFLSALKALVAKEEENQRQALVIAEQKPKAEFFDAVAGSKDAIAMGDVAKVLAIPGMGRNNLFKFLRDEKILMQDNQPYQEFIDREYFRVIEQKWNEADGSVRVSFKTLVYQKGLDFIRRTVTKSKGNQSGLMLAPERSASR